MFPPAEPSATLESVKSGRYKLYLTHLKGSRRLLFLAIVFNDPRMKSKKYYRVLMILPYAFPGFLSALVWAGMMNQEFGFINVVLFGGADIRIQVRCSAGFYVRSLAWSPRTLRRYKKEVIRLLAEVSLVLVQALLIGDWCQWCLRYGATLVTGFVLSIGLWWATGRETPEAAGALEAV